MNNKFDYIDLSNLETREYSLEEQYYLLDNKNKLEKYKHIVEFIKNPIKEIQIDAVKSSGLYISVIY